MKRFENDLMILRGALNHILQLAATSQERIKFEREVLCLYAVREQELLENIKQIEESDALPKEAQNG